MRLLAAYVKNDAETDLLEVFQRKPQAGSPNETREDTER
jgi:hypothetical protein